MPSFNSALSVVSPLVSAVVGGVMVHVLGRLAEEHKANVSLKAKFKEVRFVEFHKKMTEVVAEAFQKLTKSVDACLDFDTADSLYKSPEHFAAAHAHSQKMADEAKNFIRENDIYLPATLSKEISELITDVWFNNHMRFKFPRDENRKLPVENETGMNNVLRNGIDKLSEIRGKLRGLVGGED